MAAKSSTRASAPKGLDDDEFSSRKERRVVIKALLAGIAIFLIATFPATWLLMLFFGNLHTNLSYWGTLPLGILVSALLGGASSRVIDV
jgi:hypothetical protein